MKKQKIITPALCFMVGISIGTHATNNTQPTVINAQDGKFNSSQVEFYDKMIADANTIEIYDTSELTHDIMSHRDGKIIVEKIIGEVTNNELDGKILNASGNNENYINKGDNIYINYERVNGAKKGDKILTYYIYSPFTNIQDDVMTRLDFIIDENAI